MNLKRALFSSLAIATLLLSACGDDDKPKLKEQFTFDDVTLALKGANLFLVTDETYSGEDGNYREYIITDGQFDGSGTTFYIEVDLGNPADDALEAGAYPVFDFWEEAPDNSKIGFVYSEIGLDEVEEYAELYVVDEAEGEDDVVISGGMDDGETMTLKYNGTLTIYRFDGTDWAEDDITGKFYFKGEVEDLTSAPARGTQFALGERRSH